MKIVLVEVWEKTTLEETNTEIVKLPTIISRCLKVSGGKNCHA